MKIFKRSAKRVLGGTGAAFLTLAMLAAVALAITPGQTRESYVAQVEPICKKNTKTIERNLQGVRRKIKNGQLQSASGQFTKAANSYERAVRDLRAVQQPTEDSAKLTKWLKQLDGQTELLRKMAKGLKEGKKTRVAGYQTRLIHNSNVANNIVLGFEFDYCLVDSSKFS